MKEVGLVVDEIMQRRDGDGSHSPGSPPSRKIYTKKDLKKFRAAGTSEAGVNDLGLANTANFKAKTCLPEFNPADLGYPVKTVPIKLN